MQTVITGTENIDALPYADQYTEAMKKQAEDLIASEMKKFTPPDYLAQLPPAPVIHFPEGSILEGEFKRMARGEKMKQLDITRYKVEPPPQSKRGDVSAWEAAIRNAQAQTEHQETRAVNIDLLNNYGANMWKMHNADLQKSLTNLTDITTTFKKDIEQTNSRRKSEQEVAGNKIAGLDAKYTELVFKNFEIEIACASLEQEISSLQSQLEKRGVKTDQ
eukprot:TRINITY_DN23641_c0_g1_i1.p1 TRINITY_DN23641_c0_g1~~TRINITY_DN23641_c0_g1_i1.p1  ORF type:complete len:219 (-),score=76.63 TRINITY_DN23641_c0_g1_i1:567-1223(-)